LEVGKVSNNYNRDIRELAEKCKKCSQINPELYNIYDVKRGLRDISGKGVLAGLTEIGEVFAYDMVGEELIPKPGQLFYRGINIENLVDGFTKDNRFGFEEVCYLLLFGDLPESEELHMFERLLAKYRSLPEEYIGGIVLKSPSNDVMNALARFVLTLYSYDEKADDIDIPNVLKQCLKLIACFPLLAVYAYQAFVHSHQNQSLIIHSPKKELSTAENILHMLRLDSKYTPLEARLLDMALVLHAEHGGGNNSTFATHVVTSSGTDTYSAMAAALGSLKGPRHGGANIRVVQMFDDMKKRISDWHDEEQVEDYLESVLNKEAFDKTGLIYGIGHAVYSLSDPRAVIFKSFVEQLANEKGLQDECKLYMTVERLAPEIIRKRRKMYKGVSANVDFYSGFVYQMLGIPRELFTPLFAISRIAGWSAHRIEEIVGAGKIIRPAYKSVSTRREYIPMGKRS
jgi:citrate synthase